MKYSEFTSKAPSTATLTLICTVFFFACNTNTNADASNGGSDTLRASPLPSTADTAAVNANMMKDSSAMMSDTGMNKKAMVNKNIKKTGSISVKMESDNTSKIEKDKSGIYGRAEVMPMFPGGENALDKYMSTHIHYPDAALDNGTEGTVNVQFAVDEHGKVYEPKELGNKIGDGLDEEALKVVSEMPEWTPGKIKGKNVKTYYTLPVVFSLQ